MMAKWPIVNVDLLHFLFSPLSASMGTGIVLIYYLQDGIHQGTSMVGKSQRNQMYVQRQPIRDIQIPGDVNE